MAQLYARTGGPSAAASRRDRLPPPAPRLRPL